MHDPTIPLHERDYFHRLISANEAEARLREARDNTYLVRKNILNEIIVSYKKQSTTKHVCIPTNKNSTIRKLNPHLSSQESILDHVLNKTFLSVLSYPLSNDLSTDNVSPSPLIPDKCGVCDMTVGSTKKSKHKENNHSLTECNVCRIILFPFEGQTHKQQCHPNTLIHRCKFCDFSTKNKRYLRKHEDDHTRKTFPCPFCEQSFESEIRMNKHARNKHTSKESKIKCNHCSKQFSSVTALSTHTQQIHPIVDGQAVFRCRVCDKEFASEARHKKHMTTHKPNLIQGPFICIKCGKEFSSHYTLKTHKTKKVCDNAKVIPKSVMKEMKTSATISNNKLDKLVKPVRRHNGNKKIIPNFRKELSKHSNSFNAEVSSEIVEENDEDVPRPSIVSYITEPIRVLQRVFHKREVIDPIVCYSVDKGDKKVIMVAQVHDMGRSTPNRHNGFSTGGSRLTYMVYCGYYQREDRGCIEMVVEKGKMFNSY